MINQTGSSDNDYLYTGEQYDSELDQYYLRAGYYDQGVGRFAQLDTWAGNSQEPITLNKYLYGNADPVRYVDPTGHFSLASASIASSIRMNLARTQINAGLSMISIATDPEGAASTTKNDRLFAVASLGGSAAFKLMRMLSSGFRKACNSFDGETLVATELGPKPIADIQIGDRVWAYNEETGEQSLQDVVHLIQSQGTKELVNIHLADGEVITATAKHPLYLANTKDWVLAKELTTDSQLLDRDGQWVSIHSTERYQQMAQVYNLTVANDHTYYVGEGQVLGHNAGACSNGKIDNKVWDHIFKGERKPGRRFHGLHHIEGGVVPSNALIKMTKKGNGGFYEADVWFRLEGGNYRQNIRKSSTFFLITGDVHKFRVLYKQGI